MARNRNTALAEYQQEIEDILGCIAAPKVFSYPTGSDDYLLICKDTSGDTRLRAKKGKEVWPLEISQRIQIVDEDNFRISTLRYYYVFWTPRADERVIDWHYHRRKTNTVEAHLHIRDDVRHRAGGHALVDLHIPTGRVPLEDIVRFLIQEQNLSPRKTNWKDILDATEARFQKKRTW